MGRLQTSVTCTVTGEAAHRVWHPRKCYDRHGHTSRLDISVSGPPDDNRVAVGFARLSARRSRAELTAGGGS